MLARGKESGPIRWIHFCAIFRFGVASARDGVVLKVVEMPVVVTVFKLMVPAVAFRYMSVHNTLKKNVPESKMP